MTRKEYNTCVDKTADRLFSFCLKSCRHRQDAEDIVQMSYAKLWESRSSVEAETAQAWLFTVAHRLIIDKYRKKQREARILNLNIQPEETTSDKTELKDLIEQAFKTLNQMQKQLILLCDYEGYSYKEIVEISGLTMEQVKVYIFRARKSMKRWIVNNEKKIYDVSYK